MMLCCVHLTVISLSILKVLRVPLSFSLFNFQGPTHLVFIGFFRVTLKCSIIISFTLPNVNTFLKKLLKNSYFILNTTIFDFFIYTTTIYSSCVLLKHNDFQYYIIYSLYNQCIFLYFLTIKITLA